MSIEDMDIEFRPYFNEVGDMMVGNEEHMIKLNNEGIWFSYNSGETWRTLIEMVEESLNYYVNEDN